MQIGEDQQEFEVLPEEEQPLVLPEREPQPQPEAVPRRSWWWRLARLSPLAHQG
jgi:hypothetical protein